MRQFLAQIKMMFKSRNECLSIRGWERLQFHLECVLIGIIEVLSTQKEEAIDILFQGIEWLFVLVWE